MSTMTIDQSITQANEAVRQFAMQLEAARTGLAKWQGVLEYLTSLKGDGVGFAPAAVTPEAGASNGVSPEA